MNRATVFAVFAAIFVSAGCASCGDNNEMPPTRDSGADSTMTDAGTVDVSDEDGGDALPPDMPPSGGMLCDPCTSDDECGGPDDRCVGLLNDETVCGALCDAETPCPDGYVCGNFEDLGVQQCIPENLTCVDRCTGVTCEGNEVCDPSNGECVRPLRLCQTDCLLSATCGNGPEDICVTMPGTPDGERACLTGCDPEAEVLECPADYVCVPLDPDNDPNSGVCFPFGGTCVDRCATVDCPTGQNCNPVTGECTTPILGACEAGCTADAECGGQEDVCLDLGINDGAHCWQDCNDSECPNGYDCRSLLGTTKRICIPLGNDCSACADNACFPGEVCNPVDDTCEPLPESCTTDAECETGFLCDTTSSTCVEVGRACNGSSWAVDCDNTVTKCTTQRTGVQGTCEQICSSNADCITGECRSTNLGQFCLPDDLGGAATCGSLRLSNDAVGTSCSPGFCPGSANQCIDVGNIEGFCSRPCPQFACQNSTCGLALDGTSACIPDNCRCAGWHELGTDVAAALEDVWSATGLSQCDLHFEERRFDDLPELLDLRQGRTAIEAQIAYPFTTMGRLARATADLEASTEVGGALPATAALLDIDHALSVPTYTYAGTEGAIAQATAELISAAGGTPDLSALDTATQAIPTAVQDALAPVISRTASIVAARNASLVSQFGSATMAQEVFDHAPYIVLPGTSAQETAADALLASNFGAELGKARRLADDILTATTDLGGLDGELRAAATLGATSFGRVVLDTPAGKVVIADHTSQTHDVATLGDEIAVLIDLGGDDTYTVPAGANASVANAVSIAIDLGGSDQYGYDVVADANDDAALLPSDADGRITPTLPLNQANGAVSASDVARQGAGRLGLGMLVDIGAGSDTYSSLRMSQGASVFGVGIFYEDGPATFEAEALAQGAAIGGFALMQAEGSDTHDYRVWHAGQGFGALGGVGVAFDRDGDDAWLAEPGIGTSVLYLSPVDRSVSNRNLAQGAGVGVEGEYAGGIGLLHDAGGVDSYVAGTFAQGYGRAVGIGYASDGGGNDTWDGRGVVQGVGEWRAGGALRDEDGNDIYNGATALRLIGQGTGQTLGWGSFVDLAGDDTVTYLPSGGGVGIDGGYGLAIDAAGADEHTVGSDASWGFAQIGAALGEPGYEQDSVGVFIDAGGASDTYVRPTLTGVGDDSTWQQAAAPFVYGIGIDE